MPLIVIVSGLIRDVSVVLTGAVTSGPLIHSAKSFTVQPVFVSRHLEDSEAKDETFNLLTSGETCCPTPTNTKNPTTITGRRWTPAGPKCRNYFWERIRMPCHHFGSRHRRGLRSTTTLLRRGWMFGGEHSRRCRIQSCELTNMHHWAMGGRQKLNGRISLMHYFLQHGYRCHSDADRILQNTNQINSVWAASRSETWDLCWFILEQLFAVSSTYFVCFSRLCLSIT